MPDGDRYSRNVERRWQKAACYIYERDDPQLVVREVMLQLGAELSDDGGIALKEMIQVAASADLCPEVRAELEHIDRREHTVIAKIALGRLLLFMSDASAVLPRAISECGVPGIEVAIAVDVLVEMVRAKISPRQLDVSLQRLNPTERDARRARRERNLAAVRSSPEIDNLAQRLRKVGDARGRRFVAPRIVKPSQEELVYAPISF